MTALSLICFTVCWRSGATAVAAEPGLILHYDCDEGSGTVLHDRSGRGGDAVIHGAQFAKYGEGWALRFDGLDDYVECPAEKSPSPEKAVTLEAWVYPEAVPGAGEPGIVGKGYASFVLTYYTDGQCWWYISAGGNNCKAPLTVGSWHHVVGTSDGATMRLYVDGVLADSHVSSEASIGQGGSFLLGRSEGDPQFTKNAHFRGMIDEVRVYDRALAVEEVREHFRTTHLSGEVALSCTPYPFARELRVRVDTRGLGDLPPGAELRIRAEPGAAASTVKPLPASGTVERTLRSDRLREGPLTVTAGVYGPGGLIGRASGVHSDWPGVPSWPEQGRGMKVLNNLVTELLNVRPKPGEEQLRFTNPRDGWVFVSSTAKVGPGQRIRVVLPRTSGAALVAEHGPASTGTQEAMRWVPAGERTLWVTREGGARLARVVVRAIPELVFAKMGADPHVSEYGLYDWEFLKQHILPNLNTMVGSGGDEERPYVEEWRRQGKRWIIECGVPGLADGSQVTADEAEAYWSGNPGMKDPLYNGIIADEFWGGDRPQYPAWTEAVRRMSANLAVRGKSFYPYCGPMHGADLSRQFMQAVLDGRHRFALERYLPEQRTETAANAYLQAMLGEEARSWEKTWPGSVKRMVVCFGYFSAPPESLDVSPAVDHKVYLDMQFHLVANDPAFFRVGGLMTYLSSYADEETVRWAAKLFRHYAIEGRADRMTKDPYILPHLRNGDFEEGLDGWAVTAAEEGSVATDSMTGYSWLEGRYPPTSQGDTFLMMRRSGTKPNVLTQTIRDLQPGRLYSLRAYTSAIRELEKEQKPAVRIKVSGAESPWPGVTPSSFQHLFPNCYSHHRAPFDDKSKAWMTYHWLVFRAQGPEATLTISDWASPEAPGGPAGQETAANFIQVQPYEAP